MILDLPNCLHTEPVSWLQRKFQSTVRRHRCSFRFDHTTDPWIRLTFEKKLLRRAFFEKGHKLPASAFEWVSRCLWKIVLPKLEPDCHSVGEEALKSHCWPKEERLFDQNCDNNVETWIEAVPALVEECLRYIPPPPTLHRGLQSSSLLVNFSQSETKTWCIGWLLLPAYNTNTNTNTNT